MRRFAILASLTVTSALIAPGAAAQNTPHDLRDLVGALASGGEMQMRMRGYVTAGSERGWTYWWHAQRQQCVSITTRSGKFATINASPAPDCRRQGGDRPGRPGDGNHPGGPGGRPDPGDRPGWGERPGGGGWPGGRPISMGFICFDVGQKPTAANRWGWQWNWSTGRYDLGNRTQLSSRQFDSSVMVQLWNGGGRIRLPRSAMPRGHFGGNRDGWWDLHDVNVGRGTIRATYRLNVRERPTVVIDRRSGRISIQGLGDYGFRGMCDTIDGPRHRR